MIDQATADALIALIKKLESMETISFPSMGGSLELSIIDVAEREKFRIDIQRKGKIKMALRGFVWVTFGPCTLEFPIIRGVLVFSRPRKPVTIVVWPSSHDSATLLVPWIPPCRYHSWRLRRPLRRRHCPESASKKHAAACVAPVIAPSTIKRLAGYATSIAVAGASTWRSTFGASSVATAKP